MPPRKKPSRQKDQKCPRCGKLYTSRGILDHLKLCTVGDIGEDDPSSRITSFMANVLQQSIINSMGISDDESSVSEDPVSTEHGSQDSNDVEIPDVDTGFLDQDMQDSNDFDAGEPPFSIEDDEDGEQEDGDWWTEYTVTEVEATNEAGAEESEEFDKILRWIDKEMLLELSRAGMYATLL